MEEVRKAFKPEFLNRLDETVVFHPLTKKDMKEIIKIQLKDLEKRLKEKDLHLKFKEDAVDFLIEKGFDPIFGARPLKRSIQRYLEDPLSEEILKGRFKEGDKIIIDVKNDKIHFKKAEELLLNRRCYNAKKKQNYFVCSECGYESTKWFAKCPSCNEWNTAVEFTADIFDDKVKSTPSEILFLTDNIKEPEKIDTGFKELNEILYGGFVEGAIYLLAGEPGIGKSTFLTQISSNISQQNFVIYVSGEESAEQVFQRFKRLNVKSNQNKIGLVFENSLEKIVALLEKLENKPNFLIIDSIQTIKSDNFSSYAGSVLQVKEVTRYLSEYCKKEALH
nr:ATPase domain-containing protein [Marinitoga lauensis]